MFSQCSHDILFIFPQHVPVYFQFITNKNSQNVLVCSHFRIMKVVKMFSHVLCLKTMYVLRMLSYVLISEQCMFLDYSKFKYNVL